MNIKELVLVISILLSIRIAEYAMKKYKEQKLSLIHISEPTRP